MDFTKIFLYLKDRLRLPRSCVHCQTIVFFKVPLCRLCRSHLHNEYLKQKNFIYDLDDVEVSPDIFCLWLWTEENDFIIRNIIVAMKDGANPRLYDLFVKWMERKLKLHEISLSHDFYSVPSASRHHPEKLRQVFSANFNGCDLDLLIKKQNKEQKTLNRLKRKAINFKIKKHNTLAKPLVLLDDVLVSGFSAKACVEVLKPSEIEYILVWAIKPLKSNFS